LDVLDDKDKFLLVKLFNQAHVTFLFWKSFIYNSLYDNDEIFDWFPKMSFDQYERQRNVLLYDN
jgi:hypothetical protein